MDLHVLHQHPKYNEYNVVLDFISNQINKVNKIVFRESGWPDNMSYNYRTQPSLNCVFTIYILEWVNLLQYTHETHET